MLPFDEPPRPGADGMLAEILADAVRRIDAIGIASSFGKMAKGSSSVITTVESSGARSSPRVVPLPSANARAPLIG